MRFFCILHVDNSSGKIPLLNSLIMNPVRNLYLAGTRQKYEDFSIII